MSGPGGFAGGLSPGRVAIVGAGQIGTMLGMALTGAGPNAGVEEVMLFDRDTDAVEASLARGAGHRLAAGIEDVLSADTILLSIPVDEIVKFLDQFGPSVGAGSLVIDTGSAKVAVVDSMARSVPEDAHAMGGHPIAGTEIPGPSGARQELLRGAPFVLSPVRDDAIALARARTLVEAVGARPIDMPADDHDRVVARTSHLPHVVAFALSLVAGASAGGDIEPVRSLASSGYRGATRLAAGDPMMIGSFLRANAADVGAAIEELADLLGRFRTALDTEDANALVELLRAGRAAREAVA